MTLSLRTKIILAFSTVVVAAIAAIVLFSNLDSQNQMRTYINRGGLYGLTDLVSQLETQYANKGSLDGAETILASYRFRGNRRNGQGGNPSLTLVDGNRTVLWSSAGREEGAALDKEDLEEALKLNNADGEAIGYLVVENQAEFQADEISPFITRMREVVLYAGLLAAFAAIILAIFISNRLLRPVKALTAASNALSTGNFDTRVDVSGNDELAVLGKTFNRMAERLQLAEERKTTLTADVAHELRTPIAVQKAQLEAMIDGVLPVTPENLETAVKQTDMLSRLVDDLRLLAMADAGEIRFEYRETSIPGLIDQVVAQFQARLSNDRTSINLDIAVEKLPKVITDPDRVMQILNNLISNALRYGQKAGTIHIQTGVEKDRVFISVRDEGGGIPDSALPHLFERFYRHEKARSRETGGTGLGLAISKKLAVLLGGDLRGENDPRGGAIFTLELPIQLK